MSKLFLVTFSTGDEGSGDEEVVGLHQGEGSEGDTSIYYSICTNLHTFEDPEDKSQFTPDKNMQPIFGSSKQLCSGMSKLIKNHLTKN